jgi:Carboxypeptidase regulatory-like domain
MRALDPTQHKCTFCSNCYRYRHRDRKRPERRCDPRANVAAHNMDTGVTSSATSNSAGVYRIGFLPIGRYQVTVVATGFGTQTLPVFQLEALQTASFNLKVATGSVSTTVSVSEAAPILNTNDPTLGSTFTANTIRNFPLNGLDFSALTLYVPGRSEYRGNLRHHQHRAQHLLHRFSEPKRKSGPGEQLHPGWDRYE